MDGPNLVLIVVPAAISLVLAIGIALPFIADRYRAGVLAFPATGPGVDLRIAEPIASQLGDLPLLCGRNRAHKPRASRG